MASQNSLQYMNDVNATHRKVAKLNELKARPTAPIREVKKEHLAADNFGSAPGKNPYYSKVNKKQRPLYAN